MRPALDRFNPIAGFYDRLAALVFGKAILKSQLCHLDLIQKEANVLVLGGGTGRWLAKLLIQNLTCEVWYVEASSKMLSKARALNDNDRVHFIHGTENDIPDIKFDAIVTHFFLDMYGEDKLGPLANKLRTKLNEGGIWIVSDFTDRKYWQKIFLKVMYAFFRLVGAIDIRMLPQWNHILMANSFRCDGFRSFYGEFIECRAYRCVAK